MIVGIEVGTQRDTMLWHIKKSRWVTGPKLPKNILLYHASATAINSSHVVFIGANAYFDGASKIFQWCYSKYSILKFSSFSRIFWLWLPSNWWWKIWNLLVQSSNVQFSNQPLEFFSWYTNGWFQMLCWLHVSNFICSFHNQRWKRVSKLLLWILFL